MADDTFTQADANPGLPSPKQFRANFKEILDAETTFGSAKSARLELLENVKEMIETFLNNGSPIVYLHGKLKAAGYTGSRKELSEWLVGHGLWTKRKASGKKEENGKSLKPENSATSAPDEKNMEAEKSESSQPDSREIPNKQSYDGSPTSPNAAISRPHADNTHKQTVNQPAPTVNPQPFAMKNPSQNTNNRGS